LADYASDFVCSEKTWPAGVYGHVIKTRRNDRIVKLERRAVIGTGRLRQALQDSEDSVRLNTSVVERLNLTIRQGSAYLGRRMLISGPVAGTSRRSPRIASLPLQFRQASSGLEIRAGSQDTSPAGGVDQRALTLREIFSSKMFLPMPKTVKFVLYDSRRTVTFAARGVALAA